MSLSRQAVRDFEEYEEIVPSIRDFALGGRIVFTNGCFDILHPGHLETLSYSREVAGKNGIVVVGLNSDESVSRLKGPGRPFLDQDARAQMLLAIRYIDTVVIFDEDTPEDLIRALRPDFVVKGGDYHPEKIVGSDLSTARVSRMIEGWSTTKIVEKIRGR